MASAYVSNITIDQGADFTASFKLDDAGTSIPINLTQFRAVGQLRKHSGARFGVEFATQIIKPKLGEIIISLTNSQTSALREGRYVYDVMLINKTDGKRYRAVEGMALVNPGVTDMQSGIIPPSTPPVSVGPNPPEDPIEGNLWWNSTSGRMYVYYIDEDSGQWVQAIPNAEDTERTN
jgi:hypothetical protein